MNILIKTLNIELRKKTRGLVSKNTDIYQTSFIRNINDEKHAP
jgi:hypothetical protein